MTMSPFLFLPLPSTSTLLPSLSPFLHFCLSLCVCVCRGWYLHTLVMCILYNIHVLLLFSPSFCFDISVSLCVLRCKEVFNFSVLKMVRLLWFVFVCPIKICPYPEDMKIFTYILSFTFKTLNHLESIQW